jgi:hypothetical protein
LRLQFGDREQALDDRVGQVVVPLEREPRQLGDRIQIPVHVRILIRVELGVEPDAPFLEQV